MNPYNDIGRQFDGLLNEMQNISDKMFEMDPRTTKNSMETLKARIDQTARDLLALPVQERAKRNLDAKHERVQGDYARLQATFKLALNQKKYKKPHQRLMLALWPLRK